MPERFYQVVFATDPDELIAPVQVVLVSIFVQFFADDTAWLTVKDDKRLAPVPHNRIVCSFLG